MEIEYIYGDREFEALAHARAKASRFYWFREIFFWVLTCVNLALGLWTLWLIRAGYLKTDHYLAALNLGIAALLLAGRYVGGPIYRRWYLRQQLMADRHVKLTVDEEGIGGVLGGNQSHSKWSAIIRADETRDHFVVWINHLQGYSIPKSALAGAAAEQWLRSLILEKIENVRSYR